MVRILAVASRATSASPLDFGRDADVTYADRFDTLPDAIDVVVLDAAAGDGWPVDNALTASARCRGRCALVVLCNSAADATLIEKRTASSGVAAVVGGRLEPGDLAALVNGMVARSRGTSKPDAG